MNNSLRALLWSLLQREGDGILGDPRRLKAFLSDLAPGRPRDVSALIAAVETGVVARLAIADRSVVSQGNLIATLTRVLSHERAIIPEVASWAVTTWAGALGIAIGLPPQVLAVSSAGPGHGEMWVVTRDGRLRHRWWSKNDGWSAWVDMDPPKEQSLVGVAAGSMGDWSHELLAIDVEGVVWHRRWEGDNWSSWARIGLEGERLWRA